MISLVLSDIDGTLIHHEPTISHEDCQAIQELKDAHIDFGLVTGRDIGFCRKLLHTHGLTANCIIANNGASLWLDDTKILEDHIEAKETIRVMRGLEEYVPLCHPFICNEQQEFFLMKDSYAKEAQYQEALKLLSYLGTLRQEDLISYVTKHQMPAVKISLFTYDKTNRDYLLPILKEKYPDYEVLPTSHDYIEITRKGVHKGKTLEEAMKHLGIDASEVAVIGDGWNDLPMFSRTAHSFAMAQAPDEVKKQAAYVVKNVAEVLHSVIQYNKTGSMKARKALEGHDYGEK